MLTLILQSAAVGAVVGGVTYVVTLVIRSRAHGRQ